VYCNTPSSHWYRKFFSFLSPCYRVHVYVPAVHVLLVFAVCVVGRPIGLSAPAADQGAPTTQALMASFVSLPALYAVATAVRRVNESVRLEVYVGAATALTLVLLLLASCVLEIPTYPEGLDASLVPWRTPTVRIANAGGRLCKTLVGIDPYPLDADAMMTQAGVTREKMWRFSGDSSMLDGLEAAVKSFNEESNLTLIGQVAVRTTLVRSMRVRARIEEHLRTPAGAEALAVPVSRPVFIVGLPRTGPLPLPLAEPPRPGAGVSRGGWLAGWLAAS
jgi:hypothetical protein